jgi:hypothetical protein
MQDKNEQIQATTSTEASAHPAGEMKLPARSRIGARARALSGLALGIGMAIVSTDPDTTIRPGMLG